MTATDFAMPALGGWRVLVVDADADAAASTAGVLRLYHFDAHTARTGAAVLSAVAADPPAAVVIDLDLPDADPCEVIRRVRARPNPPAVVVLTGHTDLAHRRAAAAAGADKYLLKPAEPAELAALLRLICRQPAAGA